jgi:hypothetical protein
MVVPLVNVLVGNPAILKQVNLVRLLRQLRLYGAASRLIWRGRPDWTLKQSPISPMNCSSKN